MLHKLGLYQAWRRYGYGFVVLRAEATLGYTSDVLLYSADA
jgi:hypothetical protein